MPGRTESTGHTPHEIYTEQYSSGGQYQVYTSGTRAIFESGAAAEFEPGSTLDIESGALLNIAGIARVPSGGKIELKSGAELELEAASTMNVESGAHVNVHSGGIMRVSSGGYLENRGVRTYTCATAALNVYDRVSVIKSSNKFEWTIPAPGTHIGIEKTIIFQSVKSDGKNIALNVANKIVNFGTTSKHSIQAPATNPRLLSATGAVAPIVVNLYAQSSASWLILTNLSTDIDEGKLLVTSSTGNA